MKSSLYLGEVMHQRQDKHAYRFAYRVFNLLVDVDELPWLSRRLHFFSYNRFNLFSLNDRDHGARDGTPLRDWAERELSRRGIELGGGRIRLLCFPRVLGYVFSPLCVWYCEHRGGSLRAVICEVRNTFGGIHHYVLSRGDGTPMDWRVEYRVSKVFHVSPFLSQDMEYRFRFLAPGARIGVYIDEYQHDILMFKACISARSVPLTDDRLIGLFCGMPLLPFKVMAAIHWQALKLWLRGAKLHRMPPQGIYPERVTKQP
ncbi:MAG TPA: DUF1365 domain-containing protein [Gammaproteobacteria bacterium]|jgi:hypothetical protein